METIRFIADVNVGKLAKWLRMVGFDTLSFDGIEDSELVIIAKNEGRIVLTRDTGIIARKLIAGGQVKGILIESDRLNWQIKQVIKELKIDYSQIKPLTICLECNQLLVSRERAEVKDRVPPYVYETQEQFVECPQCNRIYWKGTHWEAMQRKIGNMIE